MTTNKFFEIKKYSKKKNYYIFSLKFLIHYYHLLKLLNLLYTFIKKNNY